MGIGNGNKGQCKQEQRAWNKKQAQIGEQGKDITIEKDHRAGEVKREQKAQEKKYCRIKNRI